MKNRSLLGLWFHSWKNDEIRWQGQIIGRPQDGVYLVQLYEWVVGYPSNKLLIPIDQMLAEKWTFYDTDVVMNEEYEHASRRRKDHAAQNAT